VSPNRGKRPTKRRTGGGGGATRPSALVATRRQGLLAFGVLFAALFLIVAIAEGLGSPDVPSGDVALVEEVPGDIGNISQEEFDRALAQAAAQSGVKKVPKPGDDQYDELKETALSGMLDMVWIRGQAEEMGVSVTPKEVRDEFKKLKDENFKNEAEYQKFLKESNYTQADVNQRVEVQIIGTEIQKKITDSAPKPSDSEIEDYYEAAKSTQFTQKATRDVRLVVNKDEAKAEKAKALLEKDDSAANWKKVAKKYSEDTVTKENGGQQKGLAEGVLEEPLNEAVFNTPEGRVEGLVKTDRGYYVFMVENSTPENVQELSEVESQIKSQLEQQAQQEVFGEFVTDYTARWKSRTFCAEDFTIERCANFEAPAHSATAPPACYEEDPKDGLPEACPAPVFQLIPAVPGSVTPVERRGRPLPQRPIPGATGESAEAPPGLTLPTTP
jgi:parvulin-like peptidyl-prolyl isomerase